VAGIVAFRVETADISVPEAAPSAATADTL
jgi:hypothetical protein